jgi:hypothetical protein
MYLAAKIKVICNKSHLENFIYALINPQNVFNKD